MANIRRMTKKRLGELLLQEGLISEEQCQEALEEQKKTGELVGEILVRKGYVNESDVARTIATQFSFPYLSVTHYYVSPEMKDLFKLETLEKYCFVPIDRFGDVLGIVIAGLLDQDIIDEIEKHTKSTIQVYVGKVSEVKQIIKERFAGNIEKAGAVATAEASPSMDVTAPPTLTPIKKSRDSEDEDQDMPPGAVQDADEKAAGRSDEAVMQELEQQFQKFRFFDDDNKEKKEAPKG